MRHAYAGQPGRAELLAWYRRARQRTRDIFDLIVPEAYYDRPITLRNPIVFYEGHLPAFSVNTLVKRTYGRAGIDARLEVLFARGIDPEDETAAASPTAMWPSRDEVHAYAAAADALVDPDDRPDGGHHHDRDRLRGDARSRSRERVGRSRGGAGFIGGGCERRCRRRRGARRTRDRRCRDRCGPGHA
jgi:hypothetical protein